jgi:hypothetical protein
MSENENDNGAEDTPADAPPEPDAPLGQLIVLSGGREDTPEPQPNTVNHAMIQLLENTLELVREGKVTALMLGHNATHHPDNLFTQHLATETVAAKKDLLAMTMLLQRGLLQKI